VRIRPSENRMRQGKRTKLGHYPAKELRGGLGGGEARTAGHALLVPTSINRLLANRRLLAEVSSLDTIPLFGYKSADGRWLVLVLPIILSKVTPFPTFSP
jgi:hypothetical protein